MSSSRTRRASVTASRNRPDESSLSDHCVGGAEEDAPQSCAFDVGPALKFGAAGRRESSDELPRVEGHHPEVVARVGSCEQVVPVEFHCCRQFDEVARGPNEVLAYLAAQVPERLPEGVPGGVGLEVGPQEINEKLPAGASMGTAGEIRRQRQWLADFEQRSIRVR